MNLTMPTTEGIHDKEVGTDGKNARNVKCKYCGSIILTPSSATFSSSEYDLPLIQQKKSSSLDPETEKISTFWVVNEMYTFHNVGFSNTVGNTKYLTCADCEAGPVGYHDIPSKVSYVALSRVEHA